MLISETYNLIRKNKIFAFFLVSVLGNNLSVYFLYLCVFLLVFVCFSGILKSFCVFLLVFENVFVCFLLAFEEVFVCLCSSLVCVQLGQLADGWAPGERMFFWRGRKLHYGSIDVFQVWPKLESGTRYQI